MNSKNNLFNPTNEHIILRNVVRKFTVEEILPNATKNNRDEVFDKNIFEKMGKLGLLGITVDEKYGGSGMDAVSAVIAHEEIAAHDPAIALSYLAHSILCVNNIAVNANEKQKKKILPDLCNGKNIGAMGLSETIAGTDIFSMKTNAKKKGNSYIINGSKMWITNGVIDNNKRTCDILYLYARSGEKKLISTFFIEKNTPGFYVGQHIKNKLGMRSSPTSELIFNECHIPIDNIIGKEGDSIKNMMRNLQLERITLAAISLGIAKNCIYIMHKYAKERIAFGKSIINFGQIQQYIADSYSEYMACKTYVYNIANNINMNTYDARIDSDSVKLISSKMGKKVADNAIQVLGGNGYIDEYIVERLWRDSKLLEIGGGTNEALQKNIVKDLAKFENLSWL